ncbi:hypothetical protein GRS96_12315 [Rathayibacter sp. VKM Ac-2803]|uniref:hypothetical protein n=1 Tax=Rathayibacter sp. VKM Ac-2803 TaxID=2609256 RepID=UPI00135B65B1|nr:hypothetical protein [Rathayibacter sp. VKM Ac-2803]MWV50053.1 hypothetical protein [Rathayibacter sp. VKM Ac-2803]
MENVNVVALVVAVLGAGGIGVFFRELVSIITLIRTGVSAKEANRKNDLVAQRDREYHRAEAADQRADAEGRNRRRLEEYSSVLRRRLIDHGLPPAELPKWPDLEPIPAPTLPTGTATPIKETP